MGMTGKAMLCGLALAGALGAGGVHAENAAKPRDAAYEAALDRYFDATVGRELGALDLDDAVASFRKGALGKAGAECPAMKEAIEGFADNEFRTAAKAYFESPVLRDEIKSAFRAHLSREDLEAFLAFAATPAGAHYLDQHRLAEAQAKKTIEAGAEKFYERPEFQTMMSQMVVKLMPAMMECKKAAE